jgi:cell division septation protein DedD
VPTSAPAAGEHSGSGFAVQVAAVRERTEADTIARRLSSKGYSAYVMAPARGAPRVFRVRVGKFKDRRQAEQVAGRLEKEEQFKPWITR